MDIQELWTNIQSEFGKVNGRLDNVEERLDNVETDVKDVKGEILVVSQFRPMPLLCCCRHISFRLCLVAAIHSLCRRCFSARRMLRRKGPASYPIRLAWAESM